MIEDNAACPQCRSRRVYRDGFRYNRSKQPVQRWLCRDCAYRFSKSERSEPVQKVHRQNLRTSDDRQLSCQVCVSQTKAMINLATVENRTQEQAAGATVVTNAKTEFSEQLKRDGYSLDTIRQVLQYLNRFEKKGINTLQPEQVKTFIAEQKWQTHSKATAATMYGIFAEYMHLQWKKPRYRYDQKIPFVPTEKEIDDLIAGTGRKTSTFLRTLKETGCRMGEALKLKWQDIDFAKNTITINNPEKNSLPRLLKVSPTLMAMLNALPKEGESVFHRSRSTVEANYRSQRNKLTIKLGNPRLKQITLRTFRHFYATTLYAKTLNILRVQQNLGHKRLQNTQVYTHLISDNANLEYDVATAETDAERKAIIKAGYQFVEQDKVGMSYYRKPKCL